MSKVSPGNHCRSDPVQVQSTSDLITQSRLIFNYAITLSPIEISARCCSLAAPGPEFFAAPICLRGRGRAGVPMALRAKAAAPSSAELHNGAQRSNYWLARALCSAPTAPAASSTRRNLQTSCAFARAELAPHLAPLKRAPATVAPRSASAATPAHLRARETRLGGREH